jgi:lysophospholipase L1-like esterase
VAAALLLMTAPLQAEGPVKIYLMVGQSNMQGKGGIEGDETTTLRYMVKNDPRKEFQALVNGNGEWVEREDVWIHYDLAPFQGLRHGLLKPGYGAASGQIGPELGFGHVIGDATDSQILLIKAAWGGKSLAHDFLPPSIGKYPKPLEPGHAGYFYHRTLQLVDEVTSNIETLFPAYKGQGMEIAGICWHQGWNDQYGEGNDVNYERNLAAFIKDIRSAEHGLGVPNLPFVIATSGMIEKETPIKDGQRAMADAQKYPEFAGNVAVVDTDKPYGSDEMKFKFYTKESPDTVGYHWNNHANSYFNIGRALAWEMLKLDRPKLPSRLTAYGTAEGVRLNWQLGSEKPTSIEILRNGKGIGVTLDPVQTQFIDTSALPGANRYEVVLDMSSGEPTLRVSSDTSVTGLQAYRSMGGVMLSWEAKGKYEGFRISRDGKAIADAIAADARSFEDTLAPAEGKVSYSIQPTSGDATPAHVTLNLGPLGPADAGGALVYEPFNYPANADEPQFLPGKGGALGTKGGYVVMSDEQPERAPAALAKGLRFGSLPVTGNRGSTNRWSKDCFIEIDDSLKKAGLLDDGATLWMSYVFAAGPEIFPGQRCDTRNGGGVVTLRSEDMKEGVGFQASGRQYETAVVVDGKVKARRITGTRPNTPILVVGRITWGKDGQSDTFVPFQVGPDLKLPEKEGRHAEPFNIDQTKLSRLVLGGEGQFDEIRVGPTFESVIGAAIPPSPSTTEPAAITDDYWRSEFERVNREVAEAEGAQVVFFGDSITLGWSMGKALGKAEWEGRFAKYKPLNMGNSGDITPVMLYRVKHGNLDFAKGHEPKVAVLLCGTNNYVVTQSDGGKVKWALGIDTPPGEVADGIRAVAQEFRRRLPSTRVIILGILPVNNEAKQAKVQETNRILAGYEYPKDEVVFLDLEDRFTSADGSLKSELYTDGTHLTAKGYEVLAGALEPVIDRLIEAGASSR